MVLVSSLYLEQERMRPGLSRFLVMMVHAVNRVTASGPLPGADQCILRAEICAGIVARAKFPAASIYSDDATCVKHAHHFVLAKIHALVKFPRSFLQAHQKCFKQYETVRDIATQLAKFHVEAALQFLHKKTEVSWRPKGITHFDFIQKFIISLLRT